MDLTDLSKAKYAPNGRGPHEYDCWGVCAEVHRRRGLSFPEPSEIERAFFFSPETGIGIPRMVGPAIDARKELFDELETPEPFCTVTFEGTDGEAYHMGICIDNMSMIHARRRGGILLERFDEAPWSNRRPRFWRLRA